MTKVQKTSKTAQGASRNLMRQSRNREAPKQPLRSRRHSEEGFGGTFGARLGALGRSWPTLGQLLGAPCGHWGHSGSAVGEPWASFLLSVVTFGGLWGHLWVTLGHSLGRFGTLWEALGSSLGAVWLYLGGTLDSKLRKM